MSKKHSKHPAYDDPTAFKKQFPTIREATEYISGMSVLGEVKVFKMGKLKAIVTLTPMGYHFAIHGKDCYPTWDEIVWLRYNLIPDAAIMAMILPNLDSYINQDDNNFKFVFTMEQKEWSIHPLPVCEKCGKDMQMKHYEYAIAKGVCKCGFESTVDLSGWNERHGHGLKTADS